MQAGRLDRRITIDQKSVTRDSVGGETTSWSEWNTLWASKNDKGAREAMTSEIERGEVETTWRIRDIDGLSYEMRIVYEGDQYDIRAIREIGRREGYIIGTVAEQT